MVLSMKVVAVFGSIFIIALSLFGVRARVGAYASSLPRREAPYMEPLPNAATAASVVHALYCPQPVDPNEHFQFFNDQIHFLASIDGQLCP